MVITHPSPERAVSPFTPLFRLGRVGVEVLLVYISFHFFTTVDLFREGRGGGLFGSFRYQELMDDICLTDLMFLDEMSDYK